MDRAVVHAVSARYIAGRCRPAILQALLHRVSHSNAGLTRSISKRCLHFGRTSSAHRQSSFKDNSFVFRRNRTLQVRMVSTPAAAASSQRVVLPVIPELTNPNFLDILVPAPKAGPATEDAMIEEPVPANPLMTALKDVSNRTFTTNGANADRKSTRLNSSHSGESRMPSSA